MNNFLPGIYAKHHNKFVKNFFVQKGELDSPYFNTDHKSFIKTKSGYIAEVIYNVKVLEHDPYNQLILFICTFKPVFQPNKTYVHLITNIMSQIQDMTSSGIYLFGMNLQTILKRKFKANMILPNFDVKNPEFQKKSGKIINFQLPKTDEEVKLLC